MSGRSSLFPKMRSQALPVCSCSPHLALEGGGSGGDGVFPSRPTPRPQAQWSSHPLASWFLDCLLSSIPHHLRNTLAPTSPSHPRPLYLLHRGDSVEMTWWVVFPKRCSGTFLMVQYLGICLPVQGTQVPSLVGEDSTCDEATEPWCSTTTEPALESLGAYSLCSSRTEATTMGGLCKQWRAAPALCNQRKPRKVSKTQSSQK